MARTETITLQKKATDLWWLSMPAGPDKRLEFYLPDESLRLLAYTLLTREGSHCDHETLVKLMFPDATAYLETQWEVRSQRDGLLGRGHAKVSAWAIALEAADQEAERLQQKLSVNVLA